MNLTLIEVPKTLTYRPMARSEGKLVMVSEAIGDPKITPAYLQADFSLYLSKVFKERVANSIRTQKIGGRTMKSLYRPLTINYKRSKPWGTKTKFWINSGFLLSQLTVWRAGDKIRVGIKSNVKYPNSDTKAARVILWLERGTSNIPARPLFTTHARFMSKNISSYFKHYLKVRFPNLNLV